MMCEWLNLLGKLSDNAIAADGIENSFLSLRERSEVRVNSCAALTGASRPSLPEGETIGLGVLIEMHL